MSEQRDVRASRRRLIKAIAGSGSVIVGTKVVPKEWIKPVVDSVILPAHAQITPPPPDPGPSLSLTCEGTPPNGSMVPFGGAVSALITVLPNPGAGEQIFFELFCDAVSQGPPAPFFTPTDVNGQINPSGFIFFCAGGEARIRFSYMGESADCFWNVGLPGPMPIAPPGPLFPPAPIT